MLSFEASSFALAGAVLACGPVLIHLLNRQRHRVVPWAAMEFLREALSRNRRLLNLRDWLLLALRVLAVLLVGIAVARPFYRGAVGEWSWISIVGGFALLVFFAAGITASVSGRRSTRWMSGSLAGLALLVALGGWFSAGNTPGPLTTLADPRAPVHAVLLFDNSRSMGVETVGGSLLDRAKQRARDFLEHLPPESRVTVLPIAGSETPVPMEAYPDREGAGRAIDALQVVDTRGDCRVALEAARRACQELPELPAKRVIVFTDLQANAWAGGDWSELLSALEDVQVVPVHEAEPANVWIEKFAIEDGIAGVDAPTRFVARLRATGQELRTTVQVTLTLEGSDVASELVELEPGQTREVEFLHQFEGISDPTRPNWVVAQLKVRVESPAADQLLRDNQQALVVPVVASLPITCVDQFGADEHAAANRVGETNVLRHLLAPRTSTESAQRRLMQIETLRWDQLTREALERTRLVVIGGVERPTVPEGEILREFVEQGGPVVVMAGGNFDPRSWDEFGWADGQGILAGPLGAEPWGTLPEEARGALEPCFVDFNNTQHEFFLIDGEDPRGLATLFQTTPIFKALRVEITPERMAHFQIQLRRQAMEPARAISEWWPWRPLTLSADRTLSVEELLERGGPRVLAQFAGNGLPFLVERRIGAGRSVLVTTGITSNWSLFRESGAMYVFHRLVKQLLEGTLPPRNFPVGQRIVLPAEGRGDRRQLLTRPSGATETLTVESLGGAARGVTIRRPLVSGVYLLTETSRTLPSAEPSNAATPAAPTATSKSSANEIKQAETPLALVGDVRESDLARLTSAALQTRLGTAHARVLGIDEPIRVEGGRFRGRGLWKWCASAVLLLLVAEMLLISWPLRRQLSAGAAPTGIDQEGTR